jgi:hypothetical protein
VRVDHLALQGAEPPAKAKPGHLFADIYDWAGELRTVDIAKGASTFVLARHLR